MMGPRSSAGWTTSGRAVAWACLLAAVGWGCSQEDVPLARMSEPALLEVRVRRSAVAAVRPGQHAAALPLPPPAVSLAIEIGTSGEPTFLAPPAFDIAGPVGQVREVTVAQVPPGSARPVAFTARDAAGNVVASGRFLADFYPGRLTSNDIDLVESGVLVASGPAPVAANAGRFFVTTGGVLTLTLVDIGAGTATALTAFAAVPFHAARLPGGNLAVALSSGSVVEVTPAGTVLGGLNTMTIGPAYGVAVEAAGSVVVSDTNGRLWRIPAGGGVPVQIVNFGMGSEPHGIAVDPNSGDLIVALAGPGFRRLVRVTGMTSTTVFDYVAQNVPMHPESPLVEATGAIVLTEFSTAPVLAAVARISATGRTVLQTTLGESPGQLARDATGDFFFHERNNRLLLRLTPAGASSVVFANYPAAAIPIGLTP